MATKYDKQNAKKFAKGIIASELILKPTVLSFFRDIRGNRIVDVGCGSGNYTVALAKRGAQVIGIDNSRQQIELARATNSHHLVEYKYGTGQQMPYIKTGTKDMALMNMVIPDIAPLTLLGKIIKEVARVLRRNGMLIISNLHPLYTAVEAHGIEGAIRFNKKRYFDNGYIYPSRAKLYGGGFIKFRETHINLEYLSRVLERSGFVITAIREGKAIPTHEIYAPRYIVLSCRKQ